MVLGALIKRKARLEGREEGKQVGREEGRKEGREEGKQVGRLEAMAQSNRAWREWLQRKTEAEANGQPFDEPTPDTIQQS